MVLRTEVDNLGAQFVRLRDALLALRVTLVEDRPRRGTTVMLLDAFGDATEDALGWLEESLCALGPAPHAAAERPFDISLASDALIFCQERFNRLARRFAADLASYERLAGLVRLGRERGGEWQAWASDVRRSVEVCQAQLDESNQALFRCWQEVAERVGMTSVSVQTSNIGQQHVSLPRPQGSGSGGVR